MNNPKCFLSKGMEINTICKRKSSRINNIKIYSKNNPIKKNAFLIILIQKIMKKIYLSF